MADFHLYSAEVCPFAARTRLTLMEKRVPFQVTEIDLKAKPAWFASVSPYGKVPVLKHGDAVVWESAIINEYIEDVVPDPPLLPRDPARRAAARFWIDFANVKFTPTWYRLFLAQNAPERAALAEELVGHFRFMEQEAIGKSGGPFWLGETITLVDLTYYPWFERIPALEHYRKIGLPADCRSLKGWTTLMSERPSVKTETHPTAYYIEAVRHYADGTEDGVTARDMRQASS